MYILNVGVVLIQNWLWFGIRDAKHLTKCPVKRKKAESGLMNTVKLGEFR